MADFKRIVEIFVQVTGDAGKQIEKVSSNLTKIQKVTDSLGISTTKASSAVDNLASSLQKLSAVPAPPSFKGISKDLSDLSKIDTAKLDATIQSLEKLSNVKFSSSMTGMLANMRELSSIGDPTKVTALADALARFGSAGKLPSLTSFVNNLKELQNVSKLPSLQGLANQLTVISQIQRIPAIGSFVKNIIELGSVGKVPDLKGLNTALQGMSNLKAMPDFTAFAGGLRAIASISKPESFAALATSLKKMEAIDSSKFPSPASLATLAASVSMFSKIGPIPSITNFVKSIQQLQNIGSITVPNFSQLVQEVNRLAAAFNNLSNAAPFITALSQLQQQLNNVSNSAGSIEKFFAKVKNYIPYRIIADTVIGMKEAFISGQEAIIGFDQSLKDLQAISGATSTEVSMMSDTIKDVASNTKFSASEVADGMIILAQAGFTATEATQSMEAVANLATGTLEDMATTVDLISTAMSIFNVEASRSAEVADILANAINKSKLTVEKLRTAINYVGPVAEAAGISMESMTASMMTLANSGLKASTIGTSLRTIIGELIDPSEKFSAAASKVGISLSELDPRTNNLSEVFQKLKIVVGDSQAAIDIFGKRASSAVLTLVNTTKGGYDEMYASVGKSGTAAEMAAIQMEGLGVIFKNLKDKLAILAIEMGEGGITQAMRAFGKSAKWVADVLIEVFSSPVTKAISQVTLLSAAIMGLGKVIYVLNTVSFSASLATMATNLGVVRTSATGATAAISGLNAASKLGLVGALVAVFTGVNYVLDKFKNKAAESASETSKLIGELGTLGATVDSYSAKIAESKGDIGKQVEANKALREELDKVAVSSGTYGAETALAARKAMQSIDGLTSDVKDGGAAIKAYQETLQSIEKIKLEQYFKEQEAAMRESTDEWATYAAKIKFATDPAELKERLSRGVSAVKEDITNIGALFTGAEFKFKQPEELISKASRNNYALALSKDLEQGLLLWEDYVKEVEELKKTPTSERTTAEEQQIKHYQDRLVIANEAIANLGKNGTDVTNTTVEELLKIAQSLNYIGEVGSVSFDALKYELTKLGEASGDIAKTTAAQWKKEGENVAVGLINAVTDFKTNSKELKDSISETFAGIDSEPLDRFTEERRKAVEEAAALQSEYTAKGMLDTEEYFHKAAALQKKHSLISSKYAEDDNVAKQKSLTRALAVAEEQREQARIKYKDNESMLAEEIVRIENELQGKLVKIRTGAATDPKIIKRRLDTAQKEIEASSEAELQVVAEKEAAKTITEDEAAKRRIEIEYNALAEKLRLSSEYFAKIKEAVDEDDATWQKANQQKLEDEKALASFMNKEMVEAIKKQSKAQEELTELQGGSGVLGKLQEENEKYARASEKLATEHKDKIEDIEEKSTDKIKELHDKLGKFLKKAAEERVDEEKKDAQSIADIYRKGEDLIRAIRQRGMSDKEKEASNELAINKKLMEADELRAKGQKENDEAALKSAENLYSEVQGMASEIQNDSKAIGVINAATAGLVETSKIERELEATKKAKEVAEGRKDIEEDILKVEEERSKSIADEITKYNSLLDAEDVRHKLEISHLDIEIKKWNEKLNLAKQAIAVLQATTSSVPTESESATSAVSQKITKNDKGVYTNVDSSSIDSAVKSAKEVKNVVAATTNEVATGTIAIENLHKSAVSSMAATAASSAESIKDTSVQRAQAGLEKITANVKGLGSNGNGLTIISEEEQVKLDLYAKRVSTLFSDMGTQQGTQKLQDMATVLNAVANDSKAASESEVYEMKQQAIKSAAEMGYAIRESINRATGESTFSIVDQASNAVEGLARDIQSNPLSLFDEKNNSAVLKSLDKIKGAAEAVDKDKIDIDIDGRSIKEVEKGFKKAEDATDDFSSEVKGVPLKSAKKDASVLEKAFEKAFDDSVPESFSDAVTDTSDELDTQKGITDNLAESAESAFTAGEEGADAWKDSLDNIDFSKQEEALDTTNEQLQEVNEQAAEPIEVSAEVDGEEEVEALSETTSALEPTTDIDVNAEVDGEEETAQLLADSKALKDKEITITVNYVTTGTPPSSSTTTVAARTGGLIPAIQQFASGGLSLASKFRKLTAPYISQGSGGNEDDVPAMLQKGEFVQRRAAVKKYGIGFMSAINEGRINPSILPKFASGGVVDTLSSMVGRFARGGAVLGHSAASIKKRLEEQLGFGAKDASAQMKLVMNNTIVNSASSVRTPLGIDSINSIKSVLTDSVGKFAVGGSTSPSTSVAGLAASLEAQYKEQIRIANLTGEDKLAYILKKEKDDLAAVIKELAAELKQLELDYKTFVSDTTTEHKDTIAEIEDAYTTGNSETDAAYKEDLENLNASYADDIASLDEDASSTTADYKEALASYQEEKDELKKEYDATSATAQLKYDATLAELKAFNELTASRYTSELAKTGKWQGPKTGTGSHVYDPKWYRYKDRFQKGEVGSTPEEQLSKIAEHLKYLSEEHNFSGSSSGSTAALSTDLQVEWADKLADYTTRVEEENPEYIKTQYDKNLADIVKEEAEETAAYNKEIADQASERVDIESDYNKTLTELNDAYKEDKDALKTSYDTDLAEENESYETSMSDSAKQYAEDVESAKEQASDKYIGIKETATSDTQSIMDEMAATVAGVSSAVADASASLTSGVNSVASIMKGFFHAPTQEEILKKFYKSLGIKGYNTGGLINSTPFSTPGKDSILAALTPGEFVINESAVKMFGSGFFASLNNFKIPRFNTGGIVNSTGMSSMLNSIGSITKHVVQFQTDTGSYGPFEASQASIDGLLNDLAFAKMRT